MTGSVLVQILAALAVGGPLIFIAGLVLMLAVGGVIGCAECVCCRVGLTKFAPGVAHMPGRAVHAA
ncbi:MAG: hypothetical protein ACYC6C_09180 [Coriobacteriia bacterium]